MNNEYQMMSQLEMQRSAAANQLGTSYGQIGAQTTAAAVTLTGQIASAHALADSLGEVVSSLEKRLSPILSSNYPDGQKDAGGVPSCDPPASTADEMC